MRSDPMRKIYSLISIITLGAVFIAVPSYAAPSAPSNVTVTSTSANDTETNEASVEVEWQKSTDAISYSVSASATGEDSKTGSVASCVDQVCTSSVVNLVGGVEYDFLVTAIGSDGSQTPANSSTSFVARSVPYAPTGLSSSAEDGEISLSWSAAAAAGLAITRYWIRATGFEVQVSSGSTSYTSSDFTAGQTYSFSITAENSLGESASASFDDVTFSSGPEQPAAPVATVSDGTVSATWQAPEDNGDSISSYGVYLVNSSGNDVGSVRIPDPATSTSITINNVDAGTYSVQVTATNSAGTSPRSSSSNSVTVATGSLDNTPEFSPSSLVSMDIDQSESVSATAPSGGSVTISASATPANACQYSSGAVVANAAGTCVLTATAQANSTYAEGSSSLTITIKRAQDISFEPISTQTYPGSKSLDATATSGLIVRYNASGSCFPDGNLVRFTSTGSCSITASQPGNTIFSAAESVSVNFQITETQDQGSSGGNFFNPTPAPGSTEDELNPESEEEISDEQAEADDPNRQRTKVNAGSFKGYVALYALNHEGQRLSAKVGKDWVIVDPIPPAKNNLFRFVEFTGVGYQIRVRLYIDRELVETIPLLTK